MVQETIYYSHETAVIDEGCQIGAGTKIWHFCHVMKGAVLGENCSLGQNVVISPKVVVGNNVRIQVNVTFATGVTIEDDVFVGPSALITNIDNPRSTISRKDQYIKTVVRKGASLGAHTTIIGGNDIGRYALVGAGAVVTKKVLAYALVVGNPAKQMGWVSEYGHRLEFDENSVAECPESKEKYKLENNEVHKIV